MVSWGWQDNAACRGENPDLFIGPDGELLTERRDRERRAKAVCAGCPVRPECLSYALTRPERHGVWGGLNVAEREAHRRADAA